MFYVLMLIFSLALNSFLIFCKVLRSAMFLNCAIENKLCLVKIYSFIISLLEISVMPKYHFSVVKIRQSKIKKNFYVVGMLLLCCCLLMTGRYKQASHKTETNSFTVVWYTRQGWMNEWMKYSTESTFLGNLLISMGITHAHSNPNCKSWHSRRRQGSVLGIVAEDRGWTGCQEQQSQKQL